MIISPSDLTLLNVTLTCHANPYARFTTDETVRISLIVIVYLQLDQTTAIFQICYNKDQAMARFQNSKFSTLRMTEQDNDQFLQWIKAEKLTPVQALQNLLSSGFKTSVSWVVDQNAFCFSVIGTDNTKNHRDLVMTTWSDDLEEVILMSAYKHFIMCQEEAWPTNDNGQRWG